MSEWKRSKLSDFAEVKGGKRLPAGKAFSLMPTPFPYLRVTDMANGSIRESDIVHVPVDIEPIIRNYKISKDDIYVTIAGTLGNFGTIPDRFHNAQLTENAAKITNFQASGFDKLFLKYSLNGEYIQGQIRREIGVGGGVPKLALFRIENLSVPHPASLLEQRKIARILSTVDAVIEKTEAAIAKYKAIKQGMMRDLFTRGLDETGRLRPRYEDVPQLYKQTELGWVPREWEVFCIADSNVQIVDGDRGTNYPHENELHDHGYCLFLSANNVTANGFAFRSKQFITQEKDGLMGSGKLERFDVIITTRGTVGNIAYFADTVPYENIRINSGMLILRNKEKGLLPEFLYHSFNNYLFNVDYQSIVSGSAQPQLPMKDLKKFRIIKPSEVEQLRVLAACSNNEKLLQKEQFALSKMQTLKSGLMSDLLTGAKRVKVDD